LSCMDATKSNLSCMKYDICNTRQFELNTCLINLRFQIDDFRLMIEQPYQKRAIIDHRSKMLSASIHTRLEIPVKLARKVWDMPERAKGVA
jgi:hypothetical protein